MVIVGAAECFFLEDHQLIPKEVSLFDRSDNSCKTYLLESECEKYSLSTAVQYTNNYLTWNIHHIRWGQGPTSHKYLQTVLEKLGEQNSIFFKGNNICQYFATKLPSARIYNLEKLNCPKADKVKIPQAELKLLYNCALKQHSSSFGHCANVTAAKLGFWLKTNIGKVLGCDSRCNCGERAWRLVASGELEYGLCLQKLEKARVKCVISTAV